MKNSFTLIIFFICLNLAAQVGINNTDPKTTLQVDGVPSDITKADGLMAPRITLQQLNAKTAYAAAQTGAIVYVTDIIGVTNTKTVQVTTVGYYYFNGTLWKSMEERTGTVIFTASLGTGAGGLTNATIAATQFLTVRLPTVIKNLGGGIWNTTDNTYAVPVSGTYIIKSTIRLTDNSDSRSIFQAVGIANVDIADGIWQRNPVPLTSPALQRWTMLYTRIAYFTKGDLLRLYIYSDGSQATLSDASLNIALLSQN